jgi:hypothetical protein
MCTRTDAELQQLVSNFPSTPGLDFFAHSSPVHLLRHLVQHGYIQVRRPTGPIPSLTSLSDTQTQYPARRACRKLQLPAPTP